MRSSEEDKPPERQVRPEQAGSEPRDAQSGQAKGEPEVEAGKPEPKKRGGKPDRYTFITAGISALAALLGALIGGISSYLVAESNIVAEAEAAQINRRATTYADFITYQSDLLRADNILNSDYTDHPSDMAKRDQDTQLLNAIYGKWLHTDFIVRVLDSPAVDAMRSGIYDHNLTIRSLLQDLKHEIDSGKPIDETSNKLADEYFDQKILLEQFANAAKDDVAPAKPKLFLVK